MPARKDAGDEAAIRPTLLRRLYRYWRSRSVDGRVPDRGDIDPHGIGPALLRHVMLVEFDDPADTVRYRLAGGDVVWRHGREFTGRVLEEVVHPLQQSWVRGLYQLMRRERRAVYAESEYRADGGKERVTHRLYLPLTRGGEAVEMALSAHVYSAPAVEMPSTATRIRGAVVAQRRQELLARLDAAG